ncbi:MAG: NusG domain II-containing protein [Desulfomonile sp.]
MKNQLLTVGDKLLIAAILAIAVLLFFILPRLLVTDGAYVEISSCREVWRTYPLNRDVRFEVHGPLGKTVIQIKNGRARIVSSPCRNKICVNMGSLGQEGGVLVCVPNEVVVRIGNDRVNGLDAVTP